MHQKNRFASIRRVMFAGFDDTQITPRYHGLALYDDPAGGDPAVPAGGTKTYTQEDFDKAIAGLKNKNTELIGREKAANERLKSLGLPDDATPEEVKEAIEFKRKTTKEQLEAKGKFDELTRQMAEKHTKEKTDLENTLKTLTQKVQTREKKSAVMDALNAKFPGASAKLILPHVLNQLEVEEDGDEFNVFVVDRKGNPVAGTNGKMTVTELLESMAKDKEFDAAFPPPNVSGGGARGGAGNAQSNGDVILTNAQAQDVQAYRRAKALAEKNGGQVRISG